jgi:Domain of unknown function (DUF4303)
MSDQETILEQARTALSAGTRKTLDEFRRTHPQEKVYGLKFIISTDDASLIPTIATEEGLTRVAEKYARLGYSAREGDTLTTLRTFLRWANPDDGWYFLRGDSKIDEAEELLHEAERNKIIRNAKQAMENLALEVLRALSEAGAFDTGEPGKEIVANLTYQDESDKQKLAWARVANTPVVFARFEQELQAARHAAFHRVRSPNRP